MLTTPKSALLSHFPHRHDFLYADLPHPEASTKWHTESRFPLSDRNFDAGGRLYGVRFGTETSYFMLDIDKGSIYHPLRDRFAIPNICEALEVAGFTDYVAVTSSYSGGLHLYFPFTIPMLTWQVALVVSHLLKKRFAISPGVLEIFPNVRISSDEEDERLALYNGHRLPLQQGSYLLSDDWQLEYTNESEFAKRWQFCQLRNKPNRVTFRMALDEEGLQRRARKLSHPAKKFLTDLNNDIAPGWTGPGQTNFLLGRLALRSYIFGHFLEGCKPLNGDRLVLDIVAKAVQLPGYSEWCRHQHEIEKRAEEWAHSAETSTRYYPYGRKDIGKPPAPPAASQNTWNERQAEDARERLELAIAVMAFNDVLPVGISERFDALTERFRFSGQTLYRHADLWHPQPGLWKTPPHPPNEGASTLGARSGAAPKSGAKLIDTTGCNPTPDMDWRALASLLDHPTGCKPLPQADYTPFIPHLPVENSSEATHDPPD